MKHHSALKNQRDHYGVIAIFLHWLVFIIVVGLIASGKYSDSLPKGAPEIIDIHKHAGVVLFLLMALRLLWRWINTTPDSFSESLFVRSIGFFSHYLLYAVVFLQAYSGVAMTQLGKKFVIVFDYKIPKITEGSEFLLDNLSFVLDESQSAARQMRELHGLLGDTLIVLIGVHVLGALVHHIYFGDDTLRRMFFRYTPAYARKSHIQQEETPQKSEKSESEKSSKQE